MRDNAYPRVWDIKHNRRVVFDGKEDLQLACDLLFQ